MVIPKLNESSIGSGIYSHFNVQASEVMQTIYFIFYIYPRAEHKDQGHSTLTDDFHDFKYLHIDIFKSVFWLPLPSHCTTTWPPIT